MSNIKIFESKKIRTEWNEKEEDWYFSVVDVCVIFSESKSQRNYWKLNRKIRSNI